MHHPWWWWVVQSASLWTQRQLIDHSIIFTCAMIVRESQGVWVLRAELKMEEEVRSLPSSRWRRSLSEEIFNHVRGALFYIFLNICLCYGCVSRETLVGVQLLWDPLKNYNWFKVCSPKILQKTPSLSPSSLFVDTARARSIYLIYFGQGNNIGD